MKGPGRLAGAAALLLALGLAACGSSSNEPSSTPASSTPGSGAATTSQKQFTAADVKGGVDVKAVAGWKPLHVAFFGYCSCNSYTQTEAQGMEKELKKLNDGSNLTFFNGNYSPSTQANQIADAITSQKYNAFIILPIDGASVVPAVKQAIAAGINVGQMSFPIGSDLTITDRPQVPGVVMSLLNTPVSDGQVTGARTATLCEGKNPCNVLVLTGPSVPSEGVRLKAVKNELTPNVKIVSTCDGKFTAAGGFKCMQDALQITKDIHVVMSPSSDSELVGAQKALAAVGIKIGDENPQGLFKFVGLGASQAAVKEIRAGRWDSSRTWLGYPTLSSIMIQSLYDHVNGRGSQWPEGFNLDEISPIGSLANKESLDADTSFQGEWCC
jgi:ribose transport system substrate-binding protein